MFKRICLFVLLLFAAGTASGQNNMGIGTLSPDLSAKLHVESTESGLLIPRMNAAEREAIVNPANGLLVFDVQDSSFWYFKTGTWTRLQDAIGAAPAPPAERILSDLNQAGISGTSETTIGTATIDQNELATNGGWIELHAFGTISTDTGAVIVQLNNVILSFSMHSQGSWEARIRFYRADDISMKASGTLSTGTETIVVTASAPFNFSANASLGIKASQTSPVLNGIGLEGFSLFRVR
jgi:hypothetical protein